LDGIKEIHDGNRRSKEGNGTFDFVNIKLKDLSVAGVDYGLLCVLTKKHLEREEETYVALKERSKRARLNFYLPIGKGADASASLNLKETDAVNILYKFYDLWVNDNDKFILSPFAEIVASMFGKANTVCEYNTNSCKNIISINSTGEVYSCGRSSGLNKFKMGNINEDSIQKILSSDIYKVKEDRKNDIKYKCFNCFYEEICQGGCGLEAYISKGSFSEKTSVCGVRFALFSHIYNHLKGLQNATN